MSTDIKPIVSVNTAELAKKGQDIYHTELKAKLEKDHQGEFVAIDVDSKKYFLGKDPIEANKKAKVKFPDKIFYMVKIGYPAVYTMSHHFKSSEYGSLF